MTPSIQPSGIPDRNPPEIPNLIGSRANRRREKPQLSCNVCRRRKLKCDRCTPCSTCAMRGLSSSCTYVPFNAPGSRDKPQVQNPLNMQDRIGQLENLVMSLKKSLNEKQSNSRAAERTSVTSRTSGSVTQDELESKENEVLDGVGRISLRNDETNYVESAHWTAILDEISDLKEHVDNDFVIVDSEPELEAVLGGSELPFGPCDSATKEEIIMAVPERQVVDRLVAKYFQDEVAHGLIHSTTFLKQYENFWANPFETPVMWIGLLFSIICLSSCNLELATSINKTTGTTTPSQTPHYLQKITQCLLLGSYQKTPPHTLETLLLYMNITYHHSPDTQRSIYILLGIIVRLALRMGYHRDGSHFPRLSPYEVEMRRRKWAIISLWDRVTSVQVGLPSMIKAGQCDTREPANLLDSDFDEGITEMPKERPENEHTHMQFLVVKNRIMDVFSEICELTTRIQPSTYTEILALDSLLSKTYSSIPTTLKIKPLHASLGDPSSLSIRRIFLLLVFHKAQITLHRKYLLPARSDVRFAYSRRVCVKAAMVMLEWQEVVERECGLGGRFESEKWKISSVVRMEFLVATTVLCLDFDWDIRNGTTDSSGDLNSNMRSKGATGTIEGKKSSDINGNSDGETSCPSKYEIVKALTTSYHIWHSSADTSKEAKKAATVLRILLSKAHSQVSGAAPTIPPPAPTSLNTASHNAQMETYTPPEPYPNANSNNINHFQFQHPTLPTTDPLSQDLTQPIFNMTTWLPPDVEGGNGFSFYPDVNGDPYDMANWEFGGGASGAAGVWNGWDGFDGMGNFTFEN
ncbi:fungal-specific transcription factor domain-containing protein [Cadophora sp. MPI-SDFR-AT-0126]|nr:fungal-specific transcription factor domain-containing protein [Leotiomycetes sp. MPI-SDFR-AT-0126]